MPVLGSDEAIKLLRLARPKSLESDAQAAFVSKWVSHRWKLLSAPPPIIEPSHSLNSNCFQGRHMGRNPGQKEADMEDSSAKTWVLFPLTIPSRSPSSLSRFSPPYNFPIFSLPFVILLRPADN